MGLETIVLCLSSREVPWKAGVLQRVMERGQESVFIPHFSRGGPCSRLSRVVFQVLMSELFFLGKQDSSRFGFLFVWFFFVCLFLNAKTEFKSKSGNEFLSLLESQFSFPMSIFLDLRYKRLKEKLLQVLLILNFTEHLKYSRCCFPASKKVA